MTYIGLYWSWDCEDFDEVVIVERILFDYGEEPMVARIHCSNRPRVTDVEVGPGTRRWATLLEMLREIFAFAGNFHPVDRERVRVVINYMVETRRLRG